METSDIYFVTSSREFLQRRMWHDYMCVSISQRRAWLYSRRVRWSEPGWWRYWRWSHAAWTVTGRVSWGTNFSDQNRLSTHKFHRYYYTQTSGLAKGRWGKKRKQTGFALLFVVTWGCSGTSPQSTDSTRREEDVTWTLAVSADHLLSPSPSSLVTWSHPHGTWEHSPCPLLSPDRMWDAVCTLLADIYKVIKVHSQRWLNK